MRYKNQTNAEYMRQWRAKRKADGVFDAYNYSYRTRNPKSYLLHNAKSRAKKKGIEFNLTADDFEIPSHCPVFGFPLELTWGEGTKDNKPSLDRIDSSKGYIKGNVQVLSWRANNLKSDGKLEEFIKLVEFMSGKSEEHQGPTKSTG